MKSAKKVGIVSAIGLAATAIAFTIWPRPMDVIAYGIFDAAPLPTVDGPGTVVLAHFGIGVRPSEHGVFPSTADHVDSIEFFGSAGHLDAAQLAQASLKLGTLSQADLPSKSDWFDASHAVAWVNGPWDVTAGEYSLLVRGTFSRPGHTGANAATEEVVKRFSPIALTTWITQTQSKDGSGSAHTTVSATGSFSGGMGLAKYNVAVKYEPSAGGQLTSIDLSHRPQGGAWTMIDQMNTPMSTPGVWSGPHDGHYDGSAVYELRTTATYAPEGPTVITLMFTIPEGGNGRVITGH